MSTKETVSAAKTESKTPAALHNLRKRKKAAGRKKKALKLQTDKEFSKKFFEGKAKRAADKKSAFRKKKSKKK